MQRSTVPAENKLNINYRKELIMVCLYVHLLNDDAVARNDRRDSKCGSLHKFLLPVQCTYDSW